MLHRGLAGTNLKLARDHNMRVTLQSVRLHGPLSRPELAQITGLTPQAIAYMCKELLAAGLIRESGVRRGGRGQPATELAINPEGGYSVGVNMDRDHLTVLLLDLGGNVRGRVHFEQSFMLPDDVFRRVERAYTELLEGTGLMPEELTGVGLAIPYKNGYLRTSITPRSYAVWRDYPVRERLQALTGRPVYLENDASAAAFGELHYGLGFDFRNFFYVFVGVGLGGGLVVNGDYVRGVDGLAGEVGYVPMINAQGKPDDAEFLQNRVSLGALYAYLKERGIEVSSPDDLILLHAQGRKEIRDWIQDAADNMLLPLITIVCTLNPEAVLIGGRLPPPLVDDLITAVEGRIVPYRANLPSFPPIFRAACAEDAAALGAAILPFSDIFLPKERNPVKRNGG